MLNAYYNIRLGRTLFAWLEIDYEYFAPEYDYRGHKTCPGYLVVHRVRVDSVDWVANGLGYYKCYFRDWQKVIDAIALEKVQDEVDSWGALADYLVEKAA